MAWKVQVVVDFHQLLLERDHWTVREFMDAYGMAKEDDILNGVGEKHESQDAWFEVAVSTFVEARDYALGLPPLRGAAVNLRWDDEGEPPAYSATRVDVLLQRGFVKDKEEQHMWRKEPQYGKQ
jgi:hypothetical protein